MQAVRQLKKFLDIEFYINYFCEMLEEGDFSKSFFVFTSSFDSSKSEVTQKTLESVTVLNKHFNKVLLPFPFYLLSDIVLKQLAECGPFDVWNYKFHIQIKWLPTLVGKYTQFQFIIILPSSEDIYALLKYAPFKDNSIVYVNFLESLSQTPKLTFNIYFIRIGDPVLIDTYLYIPYLNAVCINAYKLNYKNNDILYKFRSEFKNIVVFSTMPREELSSAVISKKVITKDELIFEDSWKSEVAQKPLESGITLGKHFNYAGLSFPFYLFSRKVLKQLAEYGPFDVWNYKFQECVRLLPSANRFPYLQFRFIIILPGNVDVKNILKYAPFEGNSIRYVKGLESIKDTLCDHNINKGTPVYSFYYIRFVDSIMIGAYLYIPDLNAVCINAYKLSEHVKYSQILFQFKSEFKYVSIFGRSSNSYKKGNVSLGTTQQMSNELELQGREFPFELILKSEYNPFIFDFDECIQCLGSSVYHVDETPLR